MTHTHAPVPAVRFFQQYVRELISLKWSVEGVPPGDTAQTPPLSSESPENTVNSSDLTDASGASAIQAAADPGALAPARPPMIWNRLASLLDQQLLEASRIAGPIGLEFHREAVYVMAALTDECFVHLAWEGREYWLSHLLEARFFRSHFAGERFFTRIDELLIRDDDAAAEIAAVYLMALALGFRGRYFEPRYDTVIDSYRSRLFFFISRRDPEVAESAKRLFPPAYRYTIQAGAPRRLPNPRPWIFAVCGAVIAWVLVAQSLWSALSGDLNRKVCCLTPGCSLNCTGEPAVKGVP